MPKRDNDILLQDMLDCCYKVNKYVKGCSYTEFQNDDKTIDAVIRNF